MKKTKKTVAWYESPQVTTWRIVTEACIAASQTPGSVINDMWETEGEWAN